MPIKACENFPFALSQSRWICLHVRASHFPVNVEFSPHNLLILNALNVNNSLIKSENRRGSATIYVLVNVGSTRKPVYAERKWWSSGSGSEKLSGPFDMSLVCVDDTHPSGSGEQEQVIRSAWQLFDKVDTAKTLRSRQIIKKIKLSKQGTLLWKPQMRRPSCVGKRLRNSPTTGLHANWSACIKVKCKWRNSLRLAVQKIAFKSNRIATKQIFNYSHIWDGRRNAVSSL